MSRIPPAGLRYPMLGVDPGKNALGWGYHGSAGFLVAGGVVRYESSGAPGGDQLADIARFLMRALYRDLAHLPPSNTLIVERMKIYPGPQQKGDQNDLLDLAYIGGGVHLLPVVSPDAVILTPTAHEWKGQLTKEMFLASRIKPNLSPIELQLAEVSLQSTPASLRHNGWDGMALPMWAGKRLR